MARMAFAGLAKVSESGICFQESSDFLPLIRVNESNRKADCMAVL